MAGPEEREGVIEGSGNVFSDLGFEHPEEELAKAKLTSMLLLAETIAASGNLIKTGTVFGMNPLALNWAQMLRLFPVTMTWVKESLERDRAIRGALDEEWLRLYRSTAVEPESG